MGTTATGELRSRARAREKRIAREIARRDAAQPGGLERRGRIKTAVATARTALRARTAAEEAGQHAEARAAAAVGRVLDAGLSQADAATLLGLSRSAVVRLARLAAASPGPASHVGSTAKAADPPSPPGSADGETSAIARDAPSEGDL